MHAQRFDPLYDQHAIERCAWAVLFSQEIPAKLYAKLAQRAHREAADRGFRPVPVQSFTFDAATGAILPAGANLPAQFATPDGSVNVVLQPNSITFQTTRYVRWAPFFAQLKEWVFPLLEEILSVVSVGILKLEYLDRFVWSGTWSNFSAQNLIRMDSGLIAGNPASRGNAWHSHCGWFEEVQGAARRLVNINIDAADLLRPNAAPAPCIGIFTMIQDQFQLPGQPSFELTQADVGVRSVAIHQDLKAMLAQIISEDMQRRISLGVEL